MPKIPTAQTTDLVQTKIVDQPKVRNVDVSSGLMAAGRAFGQIGQVAAKLKQDRDIAEAESALLRFENDKNDLLFNSKTGYYNTQGRAAVDGLPDVNKSLDELLVKYRTSFKNQNISKLFDKAANVRIARDRQGLMQHASKGQRVWDMANLEGEVGNSKANAAFYYNDPDRLKIQVLSATKAASDLAIMTGLTGDPQKEAIDSARSDVVTSAIDRALSVDDFETAKNLREQYETELAGKASNLIRIDKAITAQQDKIAVADSVQEIYGPAKSLADMFKEADQIEDPNIRKETRRQLDNKYKQDERARQESREENINYWDQQLASGVPLTKVPPEIMEEIGREGRNYLETAEREFVSGVNIVTDNVKFQKLLDLPTRELAKVVPYEHFSYLHKSDRATLQKAVISAKKGEKTAEYTRLQTNSAITKSAIEKLLGGSPKKPDQKKFADEFYGVVAAEIVAREDVKKSKLNEMEIRDIVDKLTKETVIKKSLFGFDALWKDEVIRLTDIPPEYLDDITASLRRKGAPVTVETIYQTYQNAKKAGGI